MFSYICLVMECGGRIYLGHGSQDEQKQKKGNTQDIKWMEKNRRTKHEQVRCCNSR